MTTPHRISSLIIRACVALCFVLVTLLQTGCITKERVSLFQDADDYLDPKRIATTYDIKVQADDQLSIAIASQDAELVEVFNNKTILGSGGSGSTGGGGGGGGGAAGSISAAAPLQSTFHVDRDGYIQFPVFGRIYVEGLSRKDVADTIQTRLRDGYIKDAVVSVELLSFHVVVVGGVEDEKILTISKDRCTLVEAVTMAGGFSPTAYRENVTVVREENGEIWTYRVDFRSIGELINSPVYYLQQNDIVYIDKSSSDLVQHSAAYKYLQTISTSISLIVSMSAILVAIF